MYLKALRIENFRGIRKTMIHLDDGTALIGENDCGISSVLDALELALGQEEEPDNYPAWLFHRVPGSVSPAGPIRLQLRFREAKAGEWEQCGVCAVCSYSSQTWRSVPSIVVRDRDSAG